MRVTKRAVAMWVADLIGGFVGGLIISIWLGIVVYYGLGLGDIPCQ